MKKAVHFGAGNIGRGFIGLLLSLSDYEVVFIDVDDDVISKLNQKNSYQVLEVGGREEKEYQVDHVRGVNAKEEENIAAEIKDADLVTAAVGPANLEYIAPAIAQGIKKRFAADNLDYLNIIACENAVQASTKLQEYVYEKLDEAEQEQANDYIGFPDSAVDRIVPPQETEGLTVKVEPFKEWIVDETQFKGEIPEIEGMDLTDNLLAFVERKIFTLNTGHAATAYLGYYKGYQYIHEAIKDEEIYQTVKDALLESGRTLIKEYGFAEKTHQQYIDKILKRFKNPALQDSVSRVGRDPIRKLGPEDRLVKPALRALKMNIFPIGLRKCIAAGLLFAPEGDDEAQEIQTMIKKDGVEKALEEVTEIEANSLLGKDIIRTYNKLKDSNSLGDKIIS
ncbi:mannitol-1-phosphate 5-dehydrogenase [Halanaerobacter jeridensis]|uniref:Mannitol-1-phosphate 5-dehydrogenase n=1 Tax=Halanaerobacter jeridensis TaxID=706427 RepID=A0A939BT79_9FIRM|nr:mannitol-1-phosphate 5-dehydrogenase [Halanaerobacter jeridensis]MBM7557961.1 mannitol-1-phosphate 5-dehydrogenase [Halanaerobacter jeridensis]